MAYKLEMQNIWKKLNWLCFVLVLSFQSFGCVSIQSSPPMNTCKQRSTTWFTNQCGRCANAKGCIHGWINAKKEKANAPPWPRFHPVPTKPVFEPSESDPSMAPEVYGRFGKG